MLGWNIAESTGGWQVTSTSTNFQEAPQHNIITKMKQTRELSCTFLGLTHSMALLGATEYWDSLKHRHTFQVQIQFPQPNYRARTVEMWVDGSALLWRSVGVGTLLPRSTALIASTALTSVLLRDIHDFKHCEISPYSEDTSVRIYLRTTQEAMLYAIKTSSGMRRAKYWHAVMRTWGFVTQLSVFCACFENSIIKSLMYNIFSGIKSSSDTNTMHQNWASVQMGETLICWWWTIISRETERGLKTSLRLQLLWKNRPTSSKAFLPRSEARQFLSNSGIGFEIHLR